MLETEIKNRNNTFYNLNFAKSELLTEGGPPSVTPISQKQTQNTRPYKLMNGYRYFALDGSTGDGKLNTEKGPSSDRSNLKDNNDNYNEHEKNITSSEIKAAAGERGPYSSCATDQCQRSNDAKINDSKNTTKSDIDKIYETTKYLLYGGGRTLNYDDVTLYSYYKNPKIKRGLSSKSNIVKGQNSFGNIRKRSQIGLKCDDGRLKQPINSKNQINSNCRQHMNTQSGQPEFNPTPEGTGSIAKQINACSYDQNQVPNKNVFTRVNNGTVVSASLSNRDSVKENLSSVNNESQGTGTGMDKRKSAKSILEEIYIKTAMDPDYQYNLQSLMNKFYTKSINSIMPRRKHYTHYLNKRHSMTVHNHNHIRSGENSNSNVSPKQQQGNYIGEPSNPSWNTGIGRIKTNRGETGRNYAVGPFLNSCDSDSEIRGNGNYLKGDSSNQCSVPISCGLGLGHLYEINKETDRPHPADADVQKYFMPFHTSETHASYKHPQDIVTQMRTRSDTGSQAKNNYNYRGSGPPHNLNSYHHSPNPGNCIPIPTIPRLAESQSSYQNPYAPRKLPLGYPDKNTLNSVRYFNPNGDSLGRPYSQYEDQHQCEVEQKINRVNVHQGNLPPGTKPPFQSDFGTPTRKYFQDNYPIKRQPDPYKKQDLLYNEMPTCQSIHTYFKGRSILSPPNSRDLHLLGDQSDSLRTIHRYKNGHGTATENISQRQLQRQWENFDSAMEIDCKQDQDHNGGDGQIKQSLMIKNKEGQIQDVKKNENDNRGDTFEKENDYHKYDMNSGGMKHNRSFKHQSTNARFHRKPFNFNFSSPCKPRSKLRPNLISAMTQRPCKKRIGERDPIGRYVSLSYEPSNEEVSQSQTQSRFRLNVLSKRKISFNPYGDQSNPNTNKLDNTRICMLRKTFSSTRSSLRNKWHTSSKYIREQRQLNAALLTKTGLEFSRTGTTPSHIQNSMNYRGEIDDTENGGDSVGKPILKYGGCEAVPTPLKILLYCTKGILTVPSPTEVFPDCNSFCRPGELISLSNNQKPNKRAERYTFSVSMDGFLDEEIYLFMDNSKRRLIVEGRRPKRGIVNAKHQFEIIDLPNGVKPDNLKIARDYKGTLYFEETWLF